MTQPLDMPDSPGHWALEARVVYRNMHVEYRGTVYIMPDDAACKRVRIDGKMIDMADIIQGKWYRLTMPWEQPQPTPQPAIPPDVRDTIRGLLESGVEGTKSTIRTRDYHGLRAFATTEEEWLRRYVAALTWLDQRR